MRFNSNFEIYVSLPKMIRLRNYYIFIFSFTVSLSVLSMIMVLTANTHLSFIILKY